MIEVRNPVTVDFGKDNDELLNFVQQQVEDLSIIHVDYHKTKIDNFRKWYRGIPATDIKETPFQNASNVVIQVIGEAVDTLTARVMGSLYEVSPLWELSTLGEWPDSVDTETMRRVTEEFLTYAAMEPTELNLYRTEQLWITDSIKYGFKVLKIAPTKRSEMIALSKGTFQEQIIYQGPEVVNIEPEDFFASPNYTFLDDCPIIVQKIRLSKQEMEARFARSFYDRSVEANIMSSPDDPGTDFADRQSTTAITTAPPPNRTNAHWHVYECWLRYYRGGRWFSIVFSYHKRTRTKLRAIFNFLPNNMLPFQEAKLGYRVNELYGFGFAEMLKHYQEEVTAMHNRRSDNATIANTKLFWRDPANKNLGRNIELYPGALIPAGKDEFGAVDMGTPYSSTIPDEQLMLQEVASRSGVGPSVSGQAAGSMNKKGVYSSLGTMASMEEGNRRVNLNIMDIQFAHVSLGRKLLTIYSQYGLSERQKNIFGKDHIYLVQALENVRANRISIPIRSVAGIATKELKRQNDLLLSNVMRQHYININQMLQALANPLMVQNQEIKDYIIKVMRASNMLMSDILRNFGFSDPRDYVPEPGVLKEEKQKRMSNGLSQIPGGKQGAASVPSIADNVPAIPGVSPPLKTGEVGLPGPKSPISGGVV